MSLGALANHREVQKAIDNCGLKIKIHTLLNTRSWMFEAKGGGYSLSAVAAEAVAKFRGGEEGGDEG